MNFSIWVLDPQHFKFFKPKSGFKLVSMILSGTGLKRNPKLGFREPVSTILIETGFLNPEWLKRFQTGFNDAFWNRFNKKTHIRFQKSAFHNDF